ncbi:MAG: DUF6482 family protein [Halioglobus sp.]
MRITVTALAQLDTHVPVVIHSLDRSLYQATVSVADTVQLLVDDRDKPLRWLSLAAARDALQGLPIATLTLRHQSAYDEMIGQPPGSRSNMLDIPLSVAPTQAMPSV